MRCSTACVALGLLAAVTHAVPVAAAEKSQADLLFDEGRELMSKGQVDEACIKFADSMRLDPSVGALVNLARCHELQGKTASAWSAYERAATKAEAEGQTQRAKAARQLASKLEPKLSRLTVKAKSWIDGMTIRLDEATLGTDSLGVPLPIDPGEHRIEARAPGHRTWSSSVTMGAKADKQTLEIPPLEPGQDPTAGAAATLGPEPTNDARGTGRDRAAPQTDEETSYWNGQRVAGVVVGVVGVGGLIVGGVFGGLASSQWDDALGYCQEGDTSRCAPEAAPLSQDASTSATVSTVGLIAGGALLVGGLVLFLTAPSDEAEGEAAEPVPAGEDSSEVAVRLRLRASPLPGAGFVALEGVF